MTVLDSTKEQSRRPAKVVIKLPFPKPSPNQKRKVKSQARSPMGFYDDELEPTPPPHTSKFEIKLIPTCENSSVQV